MGECCKGEDNKGGMCCSEEKAGSCGSWWQKCRSSCLWLHKLALVLGLTALVAAWVTDRNGTLFLGMDTDHLFHDAIALLVLSLVCRKSSGCGGGCC